MQLLRHRTRGTTWPAPAGANPLVPVVRELSATGKRATYAASNEGAFERGTWRGCVLNRAASLLGETVADRDHAARVLGTSPNVVSLFISAWDQLEGSKVECTALLRDALLTV